MSNRLRIAAIALAFAILGLVAGLRTFMDSNDNPGASVASPTLDAETLVSGADLDRTISGLESSLAEQESARDYTALGVAYLQKVRETGDPAFYTQAEAVLDRALELEPGYFDALTTEGALALGRHDFEGALKLGLEAKSVNPHKAHNYGVIGDALVEMGRYEEAFEAFQTMVDLRPDLSSYARVSYARELTGDIEGAIEAMERARDAGGPRMENVAYTTVLLGNLYLNSGDINPAELEYQRALEISPDYPPALAGVGRVAAARGDLQLARERFELAMDLSPAMEYAILLGDIYRVLGLTEEAARADSSFWEIVAAEREAGANVDMEVARFIADRGGDLELATRLAREVYDARPSIFAADTLAWVLFKAGRSDEAAVLTEEALRTGTQDASILFHAGAVAVANGDLDSARVYLQSALSRGANFSLTFGEEARQLLEQVNARQRDENLQSPEVRGGRL